MAWLASAWFSAVLLVGMAACAHKPQVADEVPRPASPGREAVAAGAIPRRLPSSNAGRRGTYFLRTGIARFDFWVRTPQPYTSQRPLGLLLFFHGAGEPTPPEEHGRRYVPQAWDEALCDRFHLICLHAAFGDGMADGQIDAKVEATLLALGQVMADYEIVAGRGIVSAFSNGGRPLKALLHRLATQHDLAVPGPSFPFTTVALYSSVPQYRRRQLPALPAVNWFQYVGELEWPFLRIGVDGWPLYTALAEAAVNPQAVADTPVDLSFWVRPGIFHAMPDAELVAEVAETFERADTFLAPFIYPPDFPHSALAPAVRAASRLQMAQAQRLARQIADRGPVSARDQARRLLAQLDARAARVLQRWNRLGRGDPALALMLYDHPLQRQFRGHASAAALAQQAARLRDCHACIDALRAGRRWLTHASTWVDDMPRIRPEHVQAVRAVYQRMKPRSLHAGVVRRWLALGEGRFATRAPPPSIAIPELASVSLDGRDHEWSQVPVLSPAQAEATCTAEPTCAAPRVRAGWNRDGIHFFVRIPRPPIASEPGPAAPPDFVTGFQLWLEKDARGGYYLHEDAAEYTCGLGGTAEQPFSRAISVSGRQQPSDRHACRWTEEPSSYALELTVPSHEVGAGRLTRGRLVGLDFAVRAGGRAVQRFCATRPEDNAWTTPYLWGRIRLAGRQ